MKNTIGLIGGVSWESTVLYYKLINQAVRDHKGGLNSAKILINSLNYDPIVKYEREENWNAVTDILVNAAQSLEKAGADFLLLGCNTLHKVAEAIEQSIQIPFLHIADGAGEAFKKAGIQNIGLLGTQFTMEEGFYARRLESKYGLKVITPLLHERKAIDNIIYNELCVGIIKEESKSLMTNAMQTMIESGAEGILLGCTELGMIIKPEDASVLIMDTTVLHVQKAISLAL